MHPVTLYHPLYRTQPIQADLTAPDEPWKVEDRGEKPAIALKGR